MPALTFVATANAILNCGATPVLVDVDPRTWNIDPQGLESAVSDRTRAIVVVHLFGLSAPMDDLLGVARHRQLAVVEDACEAIGAEYRGQRVGGLADAGVFGFYPNKVLTTGEGGMVVANAERIISRCRAIANQGRYADGSVDEVVPGFSFRSSELAAALGRAQLASLDERLAERTRIAGRYTLALEEVPAIGLPPMDDEGLRSWFTFPVLLPANCDRTTVMRRLDAAGIESADYFPAVQTLPGYAGRLRNHGPLAVSTRLGERLLCLPFWSGLKDELIGQVVDALTATLAHP
jgi:perosamine synthetase